MSCTEGEKKASSLTTGTTPALTDKVMWVDPSDGKLYILTIAEFFTRLGITVTIDGATTTFAGEVIGNTAIKAIRDGVPNQIALIENPDGRCRIKFINGQTASYGAIYFETENNAASERESAIFDGDTQTITFNDLSGSGTEDLQVNATGVLVRIVSDESTKKNFVVGQGVPGLEFVLKAAKAVMSFKYKDEDLNAHIDYWGFSANEVHKLFGDNPVFRKRMYKSGLKRDSKRKLIGKQKTEEVYGWDNKNMLAPLYKAMEEIEARVKALE